MTETEFQRAVLDRLTRIEGKFDGLLEVVNDIEHDLYGNGQPGISKRLTIVETQVDERTSRAKTFAIPATITAVAYGALEAIRRFFIEGGQG